MGKPMFRFVSEPPLELNCVEPATVVAEVFPHAVGQCLVVLSLTHQSCNFDHGEKNLVVAVESDTDSDWVRCEIPVRMLVDPEDIYFLTLKGHVVNFHGEKSFVKFIEARIDGLRKETDEPDGPAQPEVEPTPDEPS